jgi:hypothetical protein
MLLPALMEGELVAGLPIDRSRAARAIYRDLVAGTRGSDWS